MANMRTYSPSSSEQTNSRDNPEPCISSLPLRKRLSRASNHPPTNGGKSASLEFNHQPRASPSTRLFFPFDIPLDEYHQGYLQTYVNDSFESMYESRDTIHPQAEDTIRNDAYLSRYPIRPTVLRLGPPKDIEYQGEHTSPPFEVNGESMRKRRSENDPSLEEMKRYRQKNLEMAELPVRTSTNNDSLLQFSQHSSSYLDEERMEICDGGVVSRGDANGHYSENTLFPLFTQQYSEIFVKELYNKLDPIPRKEDKSTSSSEKRSKDVNPEGTSMKDSILITEEKSKKQEQRKTKVTEDRTKKDSTQSDLKSNEKVIETHKKKYKEHSSLKQVTEKNQMKTYPQQWIIPNTPFQDISLQNDVVCHVNGVLSLPGVKETRYPITVSELKRRTNAPENLTRVEMIAYVRQSKSSGRLLLDKHNVVTSGKRSRPTILSRLCEDEARTMADGIHKMNLQYFPVIHLIGIGMRQITQGFCQQKFCNREIMTRKIASLETTRSVLRELREMIKELVQNEEIKLFELASHCFGTRNLLHHIDFFDKILALYSSELQTFM